MNFLTKLNKETNKTTTENGADTLRTTNNPLVDFLALAGSTRTNQELGLDLFKKSFAFDRLSTIRILFYLRDILGAWRHIAHAMAKGGVRNQWFTQMDDMPGVGWLMPKYAMEKIGIS